jgi:heme-degrading monooxygenase HmoA
MIARHWRGWAGDPAKADAYVSHFDSVVRPQLDATGGFIGVSLERNEDDSGRTEIAVTTYWASMEAIRDFAGDPVERAAVEPGARAVLADFDREVRHVDLTPDEHS